MTIMSLDISTTSTGVAILEDNHLVLVECIAPAGNVWKRIRKITNRIEELVNQYKPQAVIAEEPEPAFVKNNIDVYRKLTIAHGDITIMLDQHKLEMQLCTASHWRKMVGIKTGRGITRAMLKPKDIEKAKELFPKFANDIKNNDDKADAILIGYSYYLECASRDELEYNWE